MLLCIVLKDHVIAIVMITIVFSLECFILFKTYFFTQEFMTEVIKNFVLNNLNRVQDRRSPVGSEKSLRLLDMTLKIKGHEGQRFFWPRI